MTWRLPDHLHQLTAFRKVARDSWSCTSVHPLDENLAQAWQCAAEPFGALHDIAGIAWTPGDVAVEQVPARASRNA